MPTVFISYRREDTGAYAGPLHERLSSTFGKSNVFLDLHTLEAGKWAEKIDQAVGSCYVFVALIGEKWLDATDTTTGRRRLLDPQDQLRKEIIAALSQHIPVIPVLVGGHPCQLRKTSRRNCTSFCSSSQAS